jgi:hypothetical protein
MNMKKDLYIAKLKNLSDQINIMLMEANELMTAEGTKLAQKLKASVEEIGMLLKYKAEGNTADYQKLYLKLFNRARETASKSGDVIKLPSVFWQKLSRIAQYKTPIAAVGIALVTLITAPLLGSLREKLSVNNVKELTGKAMDAKTFQDTTKYINALKKVATNNSLWSKITTAQSARDLASSNVEAFKKSYITVGAALCIASAILCVIFAGTVDTFGPLIEAIKSLNIKGILAGLAKIAVFGVLAVPAVIGGCLIFVGINGFPEQGIAADILEALAPVVQLANQAVKSILELAQEAAAQGGQAQPARITRTTKKVK